MFSAATYPLTALMLLACGAQRGAGCTRLAMQVNALVMALNLMLGYVLIYGFVLETAWFSVRVPRLEVAGAGLAQWLSRLVGCAYLVWAWQRDGLFRILGESRGFRFDGRLLRSIYAIGIPASVESLAFNGGKLLVQVVVMTLGPVAVAANYIAFSVAAIMNIPGNSLSVANTTLVGCDISRGDEGAAETTMRYVLSLGWWVTALGAFGFAHRVVPVVGLYATDPVVVDVACRLLWMNCAFLVFFPTTFILPNGLRGAGDAKYAILTTIVGMVVFRIGLGHVFGVVLGWGITGVWFGMFSDWMLRSFLYWRRLQTGRWRGLGLPG